MGDPTSFTFRDNQHFELYDNVTIDRGSHRFKFGAYYFHLQMRPEQPDNARGAFTYTGQFTGNAFSDFLLGYPTSATSGIGRGDENGRTNWLHLYVQDDWQARSNLTFNAGLRYEFNQHMYDVDNRLSSIDLSVPGGRFVIASDDSGAIDPSAQQLLPLIPIPYVTSKEAGWGRGLLEPSAVRLAPRIGVRAQPGRLARGCPRRLRRLPEPVGVQRADRLRAQPAVLLHQTGRHPGRRPGACVGHPGHSDEHRHRHGRREHHGSRLPVEYSQTWSGGVQHELLPATMVEVSYMGTWTLGADNATVHNVPEPGPGPIQARRPIPQLSRINAIRFDGKSIYHGLTFKTERRLRDNYAFNVSYTLSDSRDDASSPGATESEANVPQNVRNIFDETGEWAPSSFDHRHQFIASGTYQLPFFRGAGGLLEGLLAGWRVNAVYVAQSGAPFTVNLGVDQANIGAGPAQRPDQRHEPNLSGNQKTPERWFDTDGVCAARALHLRQRAAQQRSRPGVREHGFRARENLAAAREFGTGAPVGGLQFVQPRELQSSEPHLRNTEFRPHLQRQESARDAGGNAPGFLRRVRYEAGPRGPALRTARGRKSGQSSPQPPASPGPRSPSP